MVSKKRLDNEFKGFRVPVIPRAPRSSRRKGPCKKLGENNQRCAFELLADVAGKLLQESESTCSNEGGGKILTGIFRDNIENGQPKADNACNLEFFHHGSCAESAFVPEVSVSEHNLQFNLKGLQKEENVSVLDHSSIHARSGFLQNVNCDFILGFCENRNANGVGTFSKVEGSISVSGCINEKIEKGSEMDSEDNKKHLSNLSVATTSTVKDPTAECVNSNIHMNSDSSVQFPLYRDSVPGASLHNHLNNVKLRSRDDDENLFGRRKPSYIKSFRPQPNTASRRIRKMLTSKYCKVSSKLKNHDLHNTSEGIKSFYQYRKSIYARERRRNAPFKKRNFFYCNVDAAYDQEASSESISNLPEKGPSEDKNCSSEFLHRAHSMSATVKGHKILKGSRVKFSIKSFRVPQLCIEIPETATVDFLKRTVLEGVNAIIGGGIQIGVILQGKKLGDENRTLLQAGISQTSNLDTLDFILEPRFPPVSTLMTQKKTPPVFPSDMDHQLPRSPATPNLDSGISTASDLLPVTKLDENVDNNKLIPFTGTPTNIPTDGLASNLALVPIIPVNVEALASVPVNPKLKRSESSQRRTRRPFSVAEVEALVEAVENLGTGRWRDIKMRSFQDADHRTYVDLKDKWKTLVHTASISPQQRRGEPVPQDLLNRVLSAHSYWSQHPSKQHGKNLMEPQKITGDVHLATVGA